MQRNSKKKRSTSLLPASLAGPVSKQGERSAGTVEDHAVGFAAGGGFDTYSRMIARHIGKHIPGNPDTMVENMTGAGSLVAANYMYNKAEPDGLTIGNFIGPLGACPTNRSARSWESV